MFPLSLIKFPGFFYSFWEKAQKVLIFGEGGAIVDDKDDDMFPMHALSIDRLAMGRFNFEIS